MRGGRKEGESEGERGGSERGGRKEGESEMKEGERGGSEREGSRWEVEEKGRVSEREGER